MSVCTKCGAERVGGERCKPCGRAYAAARYKELPEKSKEASKRYAQKNAEKIRQKKAEWHLKNKVARNAKAIAWAMANSERAKQTSEAWRAANKASVSERMAAKYWADPEAARERSRAWRAANPEKIQSLFRAWAERNKDRINVNRQNRRARKLATGGRLSGDLANKLFRLQKGKCPCCRRPLGSDYHMDHILPLALGGTNTDDNMQLMRAGCNLRKHATHPVEYMRRKGFLL